MKHNKLKELYEALKFNQNQFAKAIGYKHTTIMRIEDGTIASLSPKLCKAIYSAFPQVNPVWLEHNEGNIFIDARSGETVNKHAIPYSSLPGELKELMPELIEIMRSEDKGTKKALTENIHMFHEKVQERKRIEKLEREVDTLKKALGLRDPPGAMSKAGPTKGTR